jgi:tryptophan-rich hypothetical protein
MLGLAAMVEEPGFLRLNRWRRTLVPLFAWRAGLRERHPRRPAKPDQMQGSPATRLSPKKLVQTKWTAALPRRKEKHFLVTRVVEPEPPTAAIVAVEIEAVYTKRTRIIPWRELTDPSRWRRGWV